MDCVRWLDAGCGATHDSGIRPDRRQEDAITMSVMTRPLTADELDHFPDDGKRREVIAGELHVAAAPARVHQEFSAWLYRLLYQAAEATGWGRVYYSPVDVRFSEISQVQPDLLVLRTDHLDRYHGHTVFGPPDIIVEILSPSNRSYDENEKARLYAAAGVPEYWIADPDGLDLRLFTLRDGVYIPVEPDGGMLRSTIVPGLTVDLATLQTELGY